MKRAKTGEFNPIYCLRSDVDISPIALTGMKQSGLCVKSSGFEFHHTDTYSVVDEKLRNLFPKLFDWLCESESYEETTSSWLICFKPPRKNLAVFSDDRLPDGDDIITACQFVNPKVGISQRTLYLGKLYYMTK